MATINIRRRESDNSVLGMDAKNPPALLGAEGWSHP